MTIKKLKEYYAVIFSPKDHMTYTKGPETYLVQEERFSTEPHPSSYESIVGYMNKDVSDRWYYKCYTYENYFLEVL